MPEQGLRGITSLPLKYVMRLQNKFTFSGVVAGTVTTTLLESIRVLLKIPEADTLLPPVIGSNT